MTATLTERDRLTRLRILYHDDSTGYALLNLANLFLRLDALLLWSEVTTSGPLLTLFTLRDATEYPFLKLGAIYLDESEEYDFRRDVPHGSVSYRVLSISLNSPLVIVIATAAPSVPAAVLAVWHKVNKLRRDQAFTNTYIARQHLQRGIYEVVRDQLGRRLQQETQDKYGLAAIAEELTQRTSEALAEIDTIEIVSEDDELR